MKVSSLIFDAYFDREYVNAASNKSTYSIFIISEVNRSP